MSQALCVIGSLENLMLKLHILQSFKLHSRANICSEHQVSSGNLSHKCAFDRRTLLFNLGSPKHTNVYHSHRYIFNKMG